MLQFDRTPVEDEGAFRAPVTFRDDTVYADDENSPLLCVDTRTGRKRWICDTGAEVKPLVDATPEHFIIKRVCADKGYPK